MSRYLSEYKHVQRGATWGTSEHLCNGRPPTLLELPSCYPGQEDWSGVTLGEFMACEHNLAVNRQTRMLADLTLVNCYNRTGMTARERDSVMLQSAKRNLLRLAFFGLTEMQLESQYVFQQTFNLQFQVRFEQYERDGEGTKADTAHQALSEDVIRRIRELNHLDEELYAFAKQVMDRRFAALKEEDEDFQEHFASMGRRKSVPFFEEEEDEVYNEKKDSEASKSTE